MSELGSRADQSLDFLRPQPQVAQDVVGRVAQELGITREELLRREPEHLAAARAFATRNGFSLTQLLIRHREERFAGAVYPTADCLTPEQIEALSSADGLAEDAYAHLEACELCQRVADAASPTEDRWRRIRGEVRGEMGALLRSGSGS
jgi:hypothetical protein